MKPFTRITSFIMGIIACAHLLRLVYPFTVMLGSWEVPMSVSIVAMLISLVLCVGLWKESKKQTTS